MTTPHRDKLLAALRNPKCRPDASLLQEAKAAYDDWVAASGQLTSHGRTRVADMVRLLNQYKDILEVDLIARRGSDFVRRQKGQLKLDNSIIEEFLVHLMTPTVVPGIDRANVLVGPQNAFMSLSFRPSHFDALNNRPEIILKTKDEDFVIGAEVHYQFSPDADFQETTTAKGRFVLAVLAAECKVNLDKTMFQEAAGTASRSKSGCPVSKYFVLVEYLDMEPEDCRLTDIDNVFLLRHAKRLPTDKRSDPSEVEKQHRDFPIDADVIWRFVREIQAFVGATWYDPAAALRRGSFV